MAGGYRMIIKQAGVRKKDIFRGKNERSIT